MSLIGKAKINSLLILLLICINAHAEMDTPNLPGFNNEDVTEYENIKPKDAPLLPGSKDKYENVKVKTDQIPALPGVKENESLTKEMTKTQIEKDVDQSLSGTYESSDTYNLYKNADTFNRVNNLAGTAFSLTYITDNYEFKDQSNIHKATYDDSEDAKRAGMLLLGFDKYFRKGKTNWAWGVNAGFGYSRGKGNFASGRASETEFKLWTIPLDVALTFEAPMTTFFKLALTGGPSVMGLYQSRDDMDNGEKYKHRRQVGVGYFGGIKLKTSLSRIFRNNAYKMFGESGVTNLFVNLEARYHSYDNFQDDISISGASYGAGLTFEFL